MAVVVVRDRFSENRYSKSEFFGVNSKFCVEFKNKKNLLTASFLLFFLKKTDLLKVELSNFPSLNDRDAIRFYSEN